MNQTLTFNQRKEPPTLCLFALSTLLILPANVALASPNDPRFATQWYLEQASDIDMDYDTARTMTADQPHFDVVVAVLDSAMDTSHPDLADKLWQNSSETIDGVDNDNNGLIDDIHG